jgi:hypothetical protein
MTVGLIMVLVAIYAAQHGSYGVCALAVVAMFVALISVRLPRGW